MPVKRLIVVAMKVRFPIAVDEAEEEEEAEAAGVAESWMRNPGEINTQ